MELYNEDAIHRLKLIPSDSVDCIVTVPPYPCTPHGTSGMGGICGNNKLSQSGKLFDFNNITVDQYASEFYRVLKEGTHAYVMTNNVNLQEMLNEFTRVGFKFIKMLVWHKDNKICNQYYMQSLEFILFMRKGKEKAINNCSDTDFCDFPNKKMKDEQTKFENVLNTKEVNELLKDTDIILPNIRKYYIENLYDHYKHTMYVEPLDETIYLLANVE